MKRLLAIFATVILLVVFQQFVARQRELREQHQANDPQADPDKLTPRLVESAAGSKPIENPIGDGGETLRYRVPARHGDGQNTSAPRWELAAPIVDGFSDPNQIVYDQAYIDSYVSWATHSAIACGVASYWIDMPDGIVEVHSGLDEEYLGKKFRGDDLIRFLKTRIEGKTAQREFHVGNPEAVKRLREQPDSLTARRLTLSPWDRDTMSVMRLLALTRYKPAYPLFKALLKDPSPEVRAGATEVLGKIASAVPESAIDLARLLPDKELGSAAASGLTRTGGDAVPLLIEAMNHRDEVVRNRAVFALARIHPFEAAAPGLLAALDHRDTTIRTWALDVVIDMQGRGVSVAGDDLIDLLARRLADGDDETRRKAAIALLNLKGAAARARPALEKAAAEDRGYRVREYAQQSLKAIEAETRQPK